MDKILLVEDDAEITKNLKTLLEEENFLITSVMSKRETKDLLERESFDLVLLDLGLPDGSGYSLCTAIRQRWGTPIIILTAQDEEESIVTGFELGADDYVTKPFKPMELVARIRHVLRMRGTHTSVLTVGDVSIDTQKALVTKKGKEIALSALEYRLLLVFFHHPGEVLSRGRLLEEIWDIAGDFVNDNTLTVYIKRLRDKLEEDAAYPTIIRTARGLGYILGE